jgi:hypothetical protein
MAHLKITFWRKKFDRVSPLLASKGSKKHLLGHISSFKCCNFAKKKIAVSLAHIEFLLLLVHSGQVAGNVRLCWEWGCGWVWGCGGVGVGGGFPMRSNIPRSALCATLDTYNLYPDLGKSI